MNENCSSSQRIGLIFSIVRSVCDLLLSTTGVGASVVGSASAGTDSVGHSTTSPPQFSPLWNCTPSLSVNPVLQIVSGSSRSTPGRARVEKHPLILETVILDISIVFLSSIGFRVCELPVGGWRNCYCLGVQGLWCTCAGWGTVLRGRSNRLL